MSSSRKLSKNTEAEQKTKKLKGPIRNQGATCYLNCVLQVLSVTTELHDRLEHRKQTDQELKNIFQKLKETTCNTKKITKSLGIKNVYQQCDAAECLELILNQISPQASEVFKGQLMYTTKCCSGHSINEETNPFWTLPLSLRDSHDETFSVENGFAKFFQSKLFNGDNMVHCDDCNEKTEAESVRYEHLMESGGCVMVVFPQILTLLLKRFELDFNTMALVKNNCIVGVPHEIQTRKKRYKLYGMVNHMGSLRGGHYTATVLSKEDNTWYEYDDTHVYKVDKQPFAEGGTYKSSAAYLLLYRGSLRSYEQRDPGRKMQKEKHVANRKPVVPRFNKDTIQEDDVFVPKQTKNTKKPRKPHRAQNAVVDLMDKDENSQQLRKSSTWKMHPFWIVLIVMLCIGVVVLVLCLINGGL